MRYHDITKADMKNGDGLRVVLWLSGCGHHCKGCQNPVTWDPDDGLLFDEAAENELFEALRDPYISGITFSGGDPFYPGNRQEVERLMRDIKYNFPEKTIWCYTGYTWEECKTYSILQYIDVLVDGRYEEEKRDTKLMWKGSSNQRVIDVQASLRRDYIILHCTDYAPKDMLQVMQENTTSCCIG